MYNAVPASSPNFFVNCDSVIPSSVAPVPKFQFSDVKKRSKSAHNVNMQYKSTSETNLNGKHWSGDCLFGAF